MKNFRLIEAVMIIAVAVSAGCAGPEPQPYYGSQPQDYQAPPGNYRVGVVEKIEVVRKDDNGNIAGTVIGGIVGGIIGHQIGQGRGQTAATIAGAAGGAVAGHEIEGRSRRTNEAFRVTVRFDNGDYQTLMQNNITDLRTGDRVRIEGNRISRY